MEAADADFVRSMRYLEAARRCSDWSGDDVTEGRLARLAAEYRSRAMALVMNGAPGLPSIDPTMKALEPRSADR